MEQLKLPLKTEKYVVGGCHCRKHPCYIGFGNYYKSRPWWKLWMFWKPSLIKVKCPDCEDGRVYGYRVPIEPPTLFYLNKIFNGEII